MPIEAIRSHNRDKESTVLLWDTESDNEEEWIECATDDLITDPDANGE